MVTCLLRPRGQGELTNGERFVTIHIETPLPYNCRVCEIYRQGSDSVNRECPYSGMGIFPGNACPCTGRFP